MQSSMGMKPIRVRLKRDDDGYAVIVSRLDPSTHTRYTWVVAAPRWIPMRISVRTATSSLDAAIARIS